VVHTLGVYTGITWWVYTLLYIPGYTLLGTPHPYTVLHGQRTGRHTSARVNALGSRVEEPVGGSLSSVLKLINVSGLMGRYAQSYSVSQGIN